MKTYQKKVCLLGDFAVGKTSLIRRFVERRFDEKYHTTVGVVVSRKRLTYTDHSVSLLIWDLAGGREFHQTGYLAGVAGGMLVCDLTRHSTLAIFRQNAEQLRAVNPEVRLVLIANKSDLSNERAISDEELAAIAAELNTPLFVTSAKTGDDVDRAFILLADLLVTEAS